jgi:1-acyl-sn-glycerol-3-phosphate acyltransferase
MLYGVMHAVVPPLARVVWRPVVEGLDNVPSTGPVIVASNHLSFADSLVIPIVAPRKVVFLAKADYFTGTGVKGAASRAWFGGLGMIPVDRDDTKAALASLDTALEVLGRGEAFGIYPEGTRSRDGRLYRGRTGVGHLALTSGAPVVPVGLQGTADLQPVGSRLPRLAKVTVRFGEPLRFAGRFDGVPAGRARREITDEVMTAIQKLSGQQEAGVYNERPATV